MKTIYFILIAFLVMLIGSTSHASENELPDMGSSSNTTLPLSMEQELGDYYIKILRQQLPIIDDPQIRDYINQLGFKLVAASDEARDREFYFFVINDSNINAFAMPGGYIGINSGLILNAESVDELAGVLAHEIAHVTQRHLARRLEQQQKLSLPTMLAALGSVLVLTQNPEAGVAALSSIQAGATQVMINHTRGNESEADRVGIVTLAGAGFNPHGMSSFFEKMLRFGRYSRSPLAFLSTHPLSQQRITEARDRARTLRYRRTADDERFRYFQERLSALLPKDYQAAKRAKEQVMERFSDREAPVPLRYGYSLLLSQTNVPEEAVSLLRDLVSKEPDNQDLKLALTEALIKAESYKEAINVIEPLYRLNPGNDPFTMAYARALFADGQTQKTLDVLYEHLPRVNEEPSIYEFMAEVQSKAGLYKEVHESTGLYLYYSGDLQGALGQFKLALNGRGNDPYFNSRLYARIREVQRELMQIR